MGKKDFFKFPSKKTLEYILIGILFVAVLSCTMKMMKGSLNNILEGFTEYRCPDYVAGLTCDLKPSAEQDIAYLGSYKSYKVRMARDFAGISEIQIYGENQPIAGTSLSDVATEINNKDDIGVYAYVDGSDFYITQKDIDLELPTPVLISSDTCADNRTNNTIITMNLDRNPELEFAINGIANAGSRTITSIVWSNLNLPNNICELLDPCEEEYRQRWTDADSTFIALTEYLYEQRGYISRVTATENLASDQDTILNLEILLQEFSEPAYSESRGAGATINDQDFLRLLRQNGNTLTISADACSSRTGTPPSFTLDTATDCDVLRTRLGKDTDSSIPCVQGCEELGPGQCGSVEPLPSADTGCEIQQNGDSDPSCVCGSAALNESGSFNKLSPPFDTADNCLQTQFKDDENGLITNKNNNELTNRTDEGWGTVDGKGERCLPRWPCINKMNDYLNILKKTEGDCTADRTTTNWYDNDNPDNEMKVSYCQPFNKDAEFSDCNIHTDKDTCEAELSDPDNPESKICSWNPYCLPRHRGRNVLVAGPREDPIARQCQDHLHPRACQDDGNDCYWDWPLAEEINHNRDDDKKKIN